jgi:hypothetical protein
MLIELREQPNFVENFLLRLALFRANSRVHRFPKNAWWSDQESNCRPTK